MPEDRHVLLRLLALARLSTGEWLRREALFLDEWIDLTKRSTLRPILERLIEEDDERRKP